MNNNQQQFTTCLVCDSSQIQPLKGYESEYLVKCKKCDFVFSDRKPTEEELQAIYSTYSYSEGQTVSPITIKRYKELLEDFQKYRRTNNIIDIGCGVGFFLEVAKRRGWNVYATEFSEKAISILENKGIKTHAGQITMNMFAEVEFDVVTSFEVLEHINNPNDEIKIIRHKLRKGGLFYFTTPNFNALSRIIFTKKWDVFGYPEHLCFYNSHSSDFFLKRNGFIKKRIQTTGISLSRFKNSFNKDKEGVALDNKREEDEALRETIESSFVAKIVKGFVNYLLTITKSGDTLKGEFIKL